MEKQNSSTNNSIMDIIQNLFYEIGTIVVNLLKLIYNTSKHIIISIYLIFIGLFTGSGKFKSGIEKYFDDPRIVTMSTNRKIINSIPMGFGAIFSGFGAWFNHVGKRVEEYYPRGRKNPNFQTGLVVLLLIISIIIAYARPATSSRSQNFFLANLLLQVCIFAMMAMALNLQTGMSGIVNFGVIFFVGVGAITTSIASTRYGIPPFFGMIIGMFVSGFIGYLLAYPSLKLRSDYFAIVTLSLGEVLRRMMLAEPFLQTKRTFGYSVGISNVEGPLQNLFPARLYINFLAIMAVLSLIFVYWICNKLIHSPYGRVMRSIREDEDVVESYGYNIFNYKASILAIGGALFAIPGAFIAWRLASVTPGSIQVTTTFFVWGAFIIGGKGNNKGMIAGASIIVVTREVVRALGNINRSESLILTVIDSVYEFIVVDIGGFIFGDTTWSRIASGSHTVDLSLLQIFIVGLIIVIFMNKFKEGLIPETPYLLETEEVTKASKIANSSNPTQSSSVDKNNIHAISDLKQNHKNQKEGEQ